MKPRIYVVGIGSVSALGNTREAVSSAYARGLLGIRECLVGGAPLLGSVVCAETERAIDELRARPDLAALDRIALLGVLAAKQALASVTRLPQTGVLMGSSRGATHTLESAHADFIAGRKLRALTSPTTTLGNLASVISRELALDGVTAELSSACSSALQAIALGHAWLSSGASKRCVCGGAEAPLTPFTIAQMRAVGLLGDAGAEFPCRPLALEAQDRRGGLVLGEGACTLVLETLTDAEVVEREPLAELVSVALSVEATPSPTGISPEGDAIGRAMHRVLEQSGARPDAIVVHAPGTRRGDAAELRAIDRIFEGKRPTLCSNKWQLGHTFGAAAAFSVELALELLAGRRVAAPRYSSSLGTPDQVESVMVNAAGFGGAAGCLLLRGVRGVRVRDANPRRKET